MTKESIRAQEDLENYTLEGVVKYLKGVQQVAGNSISKVREVQKLDQQKLRELKDLISPFSEGERVICNWGSGGYSQIGTIVDPFVMYNSFIKWSFNSEFGANVRFDEKNLPTGYKVNQNEIVPWRCIKSIDAHDRSVFDYAASEVARYNKGEIQILGVDFLDPNNKIVNIKEVSEASLEFFKQQINNFHPKNKKYTIKMIS